MSRQTTAKEPETEPTETKKPRKPAKPPVQLLPPENPIEIAQPGSISETVNQRALRQHHELEEQYFELRRRYVISYHKIQDLILKGANIQQGNYKVQYGVRLVRRPRYKQALIDAKGDAYQQRILNGTAPHAHFRVKID